MLKNYATFKKFSDSVIPKNYRQVACAFGEKKHDQNNFFGKLDSGSRHLRKNVIRWTGYRSRRRVLFFWNACQASSLRLKRSRNIEGTATVAVPSMF
jgi:hypothetical protein